MKPLAWSNFASPTTVASTLVSLMPTTTAPEAKRASFPVWKVMVCGPNCACSSKTSPLAAENIYSKHTHTHTQDSNLIRFVSASAKQTCQKSNLGIISTWTAPLELFLAALGYGYGNISSRSRDDISSTQT